MYQPIPSPHYPRAPVTEAVVELRVGAELDMAVVEKIAQRMKRRYPSAKPLSQVEFLIDNTGGKVTARHTADGKRLSTDDQASLALVSRSSLATVRVAPYPGWEHLRDAARENWEDWRAIAPGHQIVRIGVRFINRIDIPVGQSPVLDLEQYLTLFPRSEALGQPLNGFTIQATLPTYLPHWNASLTSTPVVPGPVPDRASFALDIDVFRTEEIPMHPDRLWPVVDEARAVKNDLFERALTPAAKELFQ